MTYTCTIINQWEKMAHAYSSARRSSSRQPEKRASSPFTLKAVKRCCVEDPGVPVSFELERIERTCPDVIAQRTEQVLQSTIYILHEIGPTAFVLKEEESGKKVKVFLGDPHICSCSTFKKEHDLCIHILWVLLKKFRVPRENPLTFQLGLVEREINEILQGHLRRQSPETDQSGATSRSRDQPGPQKEIGPEDVCPICQEELLGKPQPITYCKFGCGKSVHIKCMKIWADHQKSTGERVIRCPLCRENFGTFKELFKEHHSASSRRLRAERASLHLGISCSHCHVCPIADKCYHCVTCASYHLCHACFCSNQVHLLHPFEFRKHPSQPWRPAFRPYHASIPPSDSPNLPPALIYTLQSRSLTERDYELLLQLDNPQSQDRTPTDGSSPATVTSNGTQERRGRGIPERTINSFHVEPVDSDSPLLQNGAQCEICSSGYQRGDWVRKLPCKHKFHRQCIDQWLHSGHSSCPVDGQPLYDRAKERHRRLLLSRRNSQGGDATAAGKRLVGSLAKALSTRQNSSGSSDEELEFTVSGQSIRMGPLQERVTSHQSTAKHVPNPHLLHCTKSTSSHTTQRKRRGTLTHGGGSQPCTSGLLPQITNSSICASNRNAVDSVKRNKMDGAKRNVTDSAKRITTDRMKGHLLKRQSRPLRSILTAHHEPAASSPPAAEEPSSPLAPVCSGYLTKGTVSGGKKPDGSGLKAARSTILPSVSSSSPPGRLRRGSIVARNGRRGSDDASNKDVELDSSLHVSSFKLCPVLPSPSIIAASQS